MIDGLMLVDFLDVDRRILDWYFGKEEAGRFLQYYGRDDDHTPPEQPPDSSADLSDLQVDHLRSTKRAFNTIVLASRKSLP